MFFTICSVRDSLSSSDSHEDSLVSMEICSSRTTVLIGAASLFRLLHLRKCKFEVHTSTSGGSDSELRRRQRQRSSRRSLASSSSEFEEDSRTHRSRGWFCFVLHSPWQKLLQREESLVNENQLRWTARRDE